MRVIHLMSTDDYSGAENVAINIVNGLDNLGIEAYYATQKGKIDEFLYEKNVKKVIHIDKLSIREIKRIEKEYSPDIIHAHDYRASILAGIACKKTKVIAHIHNNSTWIKNIFHPYSWAFLFANIKLDKILLVSNAIKNEYVFSKLIRKKIEVIGNPVNRQEILNQVREKDYQKKYDICCVARIDEVKDPMKFIRVINKVKNQIPNIKSVWVGKGSLEEATKRKIKELQLENNIELVGFQKNPYKYMAASKIFMLTSVWEGYGLAAFEALTFGLPTITSKVGGLLDIVNSNCGKLCETENEFYEEIIKILNNENYYKEKSKNAINRSKELDNFEIYIETINKIYNEIGGIYEENY